MTDNTYQRHQQQRI